MRSAGGPVTHPPVEQVVLLDPQANPIGVVEKATVHTRDTPFHLAFSCYLLDAAGRLLLTRRALGKKAWPGVWSNSACGHPLPGEALESAVARRVGYELGVQVTDIRCVLPTFRYRAVDPQGIVENEFCPVFLACSSGAPRPRPDEVMDSHWASLAAVRQAVDATPWVFSPWMVAQVAAMAAADVFAPSAVPG